MSARRPFADFDDVVAPAVGEVGGAPGAQDLVVRPIQEESLVQMTVQYEVNSAPLAVEEAKQLIGISNAVSRAIGAAICPEQTVVERDDDEAAPECVAREHFGQDLKLLRAA